MHLMRFHYGGAFYEEKIVVRRKNLLFSFLFLTLIFLSQILSHQKFFPFLIAPFAKE